MFRLSFVSVLVSGQFSRVPGLIPILQGLPSAATLQRDVQHSVRLTSRRTTDTPVTLHYQVNELLTPEQGTQNNGTKLHYFYPYSYPCSSSTFFSSPSLFSSSSSSSSSQIQAALSHFLSGVPSIFVCHSRCKFGFPP